MNSAHALLDGLIDYAGLFPPASLEMASAVRGYSEYLASDDKSLLGRFIVPVARLDELAEAAGQYVSMNNEEKPWRLSVIAGSDPAASLEAILRFNDSHAPGGRSSAAVCDAIEIVVHSRDDISNAIAAFHHSGQIFLEVPFDTDVMDLIAAAAGTRAAAKIRTGGVAEGSIPSAGAVLSFIRACHAHGVPFKATAGLHHAVRGSYPLTYESNAPLERMFGYLNVFLAAAFVDAGMNDADLIALLEETDANAFGFDDHGASWRGYVLPTRKIQHARQKFAMSFGSCSFTEPVAEAKELNLI